MAKALCTKFNDEPNRASRPFDSCRCGFVMSEGAAALILEELQFALKRNARIYAEIVGYGLSGDAFHLTAPPEDGEGAYRSMANALRKSGLEADQVEMINAHAASTAKGDLAESRAIYRLFGSRVPVSSTKGVHGHLLGAAGAIEAICTLLSLDYGIIFANNNLDIPDEQIKVNLVGDKPIRKHIGIAMTNSFGFGGTNASLIFNKIFS